MGVKWSTKTDHIPEMQRNIKQLNGKKVQVGVFGEKAWLASIHEYGCVITPGNAKYLTVPCSPKAKGKKASDFPDLFYCENKKGTKMLARKNGKGIEVIFLLMDRVVIPERAFLRKGYDNNAKKAIKKTDSVLDKVLAGKFNVETYLQTLGRELVSDIQLDARKIEPVNAPLTLSVKRSGNPLHDTGEMIRSITYKVE